MATSSTLHALVFFAFLFVQAIEGEARTIVDMSGRAVVLPEKVSRVVTLGAVPVLNGFLFAFGEQDSIVNGLPTALARKYQYVFAPGLAQKPIVQGAEKALAVEEIVGLRPDVIFTMDVATAESLRSLRLPAIYLRWTAPEDVKPLMALLGEIFGKRGLAGEYAAYFDRTLELVARRVGSSDGSERPRVLYVNLRRLTQPHRVADWWIARAGGHSLTDAPRDQESITFSLEQMLAWDPQVMIVADRAEAEMAFHEPRLQNMSAVRDKRVHVAPSGAHLWANRTVEQPLTVLWAATIIHPELLSLDELRAEMSAFYDRFFHARLSREQIDDILDGASGR